MANPTLKTSAPGYASIVAALWVSDVVDQSGTPSKGAWDAKNSVFYPAWGGASMSGVALGSTTRRGLASSVANCGIDLGLAANHTGTIFDLAGPELTVVALYRRPSTATSFVIQNQESFSAGGNCGWSVSPNGTAALSCRVRAGTTPPGSELAAANTTANPVNELVCIVYDRSSTVTSRIWKNGTQITGGSASPNVDPITYGTPGSYLRRAALFNYPESRAINAGALELFAVIVYNDGDWVTGGSALPVMGTTEAALLAGSFHDAYFDFGDGPAVSGDVVLENAAPAGALGTNASDLGGGVVLADVAPSGGLSSGASTISGNLALDDTAPAGTLGVPPGRIRLLGANDEWRNKAGTLLASKSATVDVHSATTGAQLARIATATDSGGLLPELSHGSLAQSTPYRVDVLFATGEYGVVYRTSEAT